MAEITVHYSGPTVTRAEARTRGLPSYFTGKPCPRGHVAKRKTTNRACRQCQADQRKRYGATPAGRAVLAKHEKKYRQTEAGRITRRKKAKTEHGRLQHRLKEERRRARKQCADGKAFTRDDFLKLSERQKKCHICGKRFTENDPAHIDHVIPLAAGGAHNASNIALAHKSCNQLKHAKRTHLL